MGKAVEDRGRMEDGAQAPSDLPYDPEQWEKRLERARADRAEVLRRRQEGAAPASAPAPRTAAVEPLALRARADGRAESAPSPPVLDPAVRSVPSSERRWKVIAFTCLGVSLLCIGIAIGATLAGLRMPVARDAAAPPAIVQERAPSLSPAIAPEADPAAVASPEMAAAAPRPDPEPIVVPVPEPEPTGVRSTSAVPRVEPDAPPGPASDVAVAPEAGPAEPEPAVTDVVLPEIATDVAVAPEAGPAEPEPEAPGEVLPETASTDMAAGVETEPSEGEIDTLREAAEAGLRLIVHAPPSVGAEGRTAVSEALRAADFTVTDPITVNLTISETHLRYYHAEDRAPAEAIADLLDIRARDFTAYRPTPQDRIVEIWMEGQGRTGTGGGGQPAARGPQRPELVDRITRMLLDRLR